MKNMQVHAISGSMIIENNGCKTLRTIRQTGTETTQVFIISPVRCAEYELSSLIEAAMAHDERLWSTMEKRTEAWTSLSETMLPEKQNSEVTGIIKKGFSEIEEVIRAIWLVRDVSEGAKRYIDAIVSSWAAEVLRNYFIAKGIAAESHDITEVLHSKPTFKTHTVLITGELPTMNHDDSEYAASLVGSLYNAKGVTYWNERSLLHTADIESVPGAKIISRLTYAEATELSFFGAPVIRPKNMLPAMSAGIPISLRYIGEPSHPGTLVEDHCDDISITSRAKGFSVIHKVALINVEGAGMSGVPGISSRLFSSMREAGISVILISQASSEYSICFAVPTGQAEQACQTARITFEKELAEGRIQCIDYETDCAILAVVGDQMSGTPGVAAKFFSALGTAGVNVRAIAQGSSERNISAVIKDDDSTRALRALHAGFFLSKQTLSVGLFGIGNIGGTLLNQIRDQSDRLKERFGVDIRIRALADVSHMLLDEEGVDLSDWRATFKTSSVPFDLEAMISHVNASYYPHAVIVDCTASSELAKEYVNWLERGIHIVTPNKKAGTSPYPYYRSLMDTCLKTGKRFYYETTVGAGLPVISTLKDLIQTGDSVQKIEGIVSGTLAWLFSRYDGTTPFSELVREAKRLGYTEPDPRDDLSGMDVARKVIILAREQGYQVEVSDIDVRSLVPKELASVPVSDFMERISEVDDEMKELFEEAKKTGKKLRYVGMVEADGTCSVKLQGYDENHPFAQANGTDNVISFTTDRYNELPLVIKGPGAGPEVTAGGVFADILRLSAYLGARL